MKVKIFVSMLSVFSLFNLYAQNNENANEADKLILNDVAREKIIQWGLNNDQNNRLFTTPKFIKYYNYYFTQSYKLKEGQEYNLSKIKAIDIQVYEEQRHATMDVEVFDSLSGLYIVLDSNEKIEQKLIEFGIVNPNKSLDSRICNNCD